MGGVRLSAGWKSPAAMPRRWLAGVFGVSAIYAALVAIFSSDSVHQQWGTIAACGYGVALLVMLLVKHARGADLAIGVSFCGALLVPLGWLAAKALEQPEVWVVARSGSTLIHQGTPYTDASVLATTQDPNAYNPYLPVMALFGLPRALFGGGVLTDPRLWFGVVFLAIFWLALRRGGAQDPLRWTLLVVASPIVAFELAVGGTDVPMVAFLCLGFAYLWQRKPVAAGLALGIGAAMKATAWPAIAIAIALLAIRDGRKAVTVFTLTALAVLAFCVGPWIVHPKSLIDNTIDFPLGLASVHSQASSPLPGHIIASLGASGHTAVVVLLALAGAGIALSLFIRPPRSVPRAVGLLAGAMTLMFVLAPSTRFGYFIYPATLAVWLLAALGGRHRVQPAMPNGSPLPGGAIKPDPGAPPTSPSTSRTTTPESRPVA